MKMTKLQLNLCSQLLYTASYGTNNHAVDCAREHLEHIVEFLNLGFDVIYGANGIKYEIVDNKGELAIVQEVWDEFERKFIAFYTIYAMNNLDNPEWEEIDLEEEDD